MNDPFVVTLRRSSDPDTPPVFVSTDPAVVAAVIAALVEVLQGPPRRQVLRLARQARPRTAKPDTEPAGGAP